MKDTKQACVHLRQILVHRLAAWDEANAAERILGVDIDSQSDEVEYLLSGLDSHLDVGDLSDEQILSAFGVK